MFDMWFAHAFKTVGLYQFADAAQFCEHVIRKRIQLRGDRLVEGLNRSHVAS
jgi:hypothetical protein